MASFSQQCDTILANWRLREQISRDKPSRNDRRDFFWQANTAARRKPKTTRQAVLTCDPLQAPSALSGNSDSKWLAGVGEAKLCPALRQSLDDERCHNILEAAQRLRTALACDDGHTQGIARAKHNTPSQVRIMIAANHLFQSTLLLAVEASMSEPMNLVFLDALPSVIFVHKTDQTVNRIASNETVKVVG